MEETKGASVFRQTSSYLHTVCNKSRRVSDEGIFKYNIIQDDFVKIFDIDDDLGPIMRDIRYISEHVEYDKAHKSIYVQAFIFQQRDAQVYRKYGHLI